MLLWSLNHLRLERRFLVEGVVELLRPQRQELWSLFEGAPLLRLLHLRLRLGLQPWRACQSPEFWRLELACRGPLTSGAGATAAPVEVALPEAPPPTSPLPDPESG